MDKTKLSDKEAAIVAAARRELAERASQTPRPAAATRTAREPDSLTAGPAAASAAPLDAAARIAALMQAEQDRSSKRRKKLRQVGIVIPALVLIAALLWVLSAIFRYARI